MRASPNIEAPTIIEATSLATLAREELSDMVMLALDRTKLKCKIS